MSVVLSPGTLYSGVLSADPGSRRFRFYGSAAGRGPRDLFLAEHGDSSAGQGLRVKRRGVSGQVEPCAGLENRSGKADQARSGRPQLRSVRGRRSPRRQDGCRGHRSQGQDHASHPEGRPGLCARGPDEERLRAQVARSSHAGPSEGCAGAGHVAKTTSRQSTLREDATAPSLRQAAREVPIRTGNYDLCAPGRQPVFETQSARRARARVKRSCQASGASACAVVA